MGLLLAACSGQERPADRADEGDAGRTGDASLDAAGSEGPVTPDRDANGRDGAGAGGDTGDGGFVDGAIESGTVEPAVVELHGRVAKGPFVICAR